MYPGDRVALSSIIDHELLSGADRLSERWFEGVFVMFGNWDKVA